MNTRRMLPSLVLAAGATASLLADAAHGQEPDPNVPVTGRPRPDYDPLGIRAGGFLIFPSFTVNGDYNDNIFADDENEESDFVFTYSPRVEVRSNFPRHSLNWTVETDIGQYVDNTDENFWDYGTELSGRLEQLMAESCREVPVTPGRRWPLLHQAWTTFLFHVLRGYPGWARWLPRHSPRLETLVAPPGGSGR